jgi:hypothetical protein
MGIVASIVSTFTRGLFGRLPACITDNDLAVAWYKSLTTFVAESGTNYVKDSIGERTDTVFYGQYLDATSGQINFYRTTGTFDYTDPSDGSSVTGVSIPGTGLYTIPANGICDIVVSDGSEYPVCERAGTVLHDVENGIHISVATPSWSETLYGSDYLNQHGYANKAASDAESYAWTTNVDGSPVALDNNTLIPLKKKSSLDMVMLESTLNTVL